jgi:endonuclease III
VTERVPAKEAKKTKKPPRTRAKLSSSGNPKTNKYNFEFGHDNWPNFSSPTPDEVQKVVDILAKERKVLIKKAATKGQLSTPVHAAWNATVDAIIRVIVSQRTDNEEAMELQQRLIQAYPYFVKGERVYGNTPNYHSMRVQGVEKLSRVFGKAGLHNLKPGAIIKILNDIYDRNVAALEPGETVWAGNPRDAPDFVPGLLSIDFLLRTYAVKDKQGLFDALVSWFIVGVKTAACIMAFNMKIPVFAVDTHVSNMARTLG